MAPTMILTKIEIAAELGGRYWDRTSDLLGVNETHVGRWRSLTQLRGLYRSDEVDVGRQGCCTPLLYCYSSHGNVPPRKILVKALALVASLRHSTSGGRTDASCYSPCTVCRIWSMTNDVQITATVAKVLRAFLEDLAAPRYGMELIKTTGLPSGTIYPVLARLEHAGWLVSEKEPIDPLREGRPPRRYYILSPDGAVRARSEVVALAEQLRLDRTPAARRPKLVPDHLAGPI